MNTGTKMAIGVGAGVVVLGLLAGRQARDSAGSVVDAVNPINPDNVFYRGANSVLQIFTGDQGTLGTKIYDWFHPEESRALAEQVRERGMTGG